MTANRSSGPSTAKIVAIGCAVLAALSGKEACGSELWYRVHYYGDKNSWTEQVRRFSGDSTFAVEGSALPITMDPAFVAPALEAGDTGDTDQIFWGTLASRPAIPRALLGIDPRLDAHLDVVAGKQTNVQLGQTPKRLTNFSLREHIFPRGAQKSLRGEVSGDRFILKRDGR